MPKDRRRGRRRYQGPSRLAAVSRQAGQPSNPPRPLATERVAPVAKAPPPLKQQLVANPHLGKDLRNISAVTVALVILLVILSIVLR